MNKLTEDETIAILTDHLKKHGWKIDSFCLGQTRGNDIVASAPNATLIVEVKGAKAGEYAPTKKRDYFNSGQIKTHFGKAIVKILDEKYLNPAFQYAIAHPEDADIKRAIGHLIPFLRTLNVKHFWVFADGTVIEEYI